MNDTARVDVVDESGSVTVTAEGTIDLTNSADFTRELGQASHTADDLTLDMRSTVFIDTQVLHELAKAAVAMIKRDKRLKVIVLKTAYPLRVLQISGFQDIMDIEIV